MARRKTAPTNDESVPEILRQEQCEVYLVGTIRRLQNESKNKGSAVPRYRIETRLERENAWQVMNCLDTMIANVIGSGKVCVTNGLYWVAMVAILLGCSQTTFTTGSGVGGAWTASVAGAAGVEATGAGGAGTGGGLYLATGGAWTASMAGAAGFEASGGASAGDGGALATGGAMATGGSMLVTAGAAGYQTAGPTGGSSASCPACAPGICGYCTDSKHPTCVDAVFVYCF